VSRPGGSEELQLSFAGGPMVRGGGVTKPWVNLMPLRTIVINGAVLHSPADDSVSRPAGNRSGSANRQALQRHSNRDASWLEQLDRRAQRCPSGDFTEKAVRGNPSVIDTAFVSLAQVPGAVRDSPSCIPSSKVLASLYRHVHANRVRLWRVACTRPPCVASGFH
jgi:hypothetical protein